MEQEVTEIKAKNVRCRKCGEWFMSKYKTEMCDKCVGSFRRIANRLLKGRGINVRY